MTVMGFIKHASLHVLLIEQSIRLPQRVGEWKRVSTEVVVAFYLLFGTSVAIRFYLI